MMPLDVSAQLRELRIRACLTQDEIAKLLDMEQTSVSAVETGRRNPGFALLNRWLGLFKRELVIIGPDSPIALEAEERLLMEEFQALEPNRKALVGRLIRVMGRMSPEIISILEAIVCQTENASPGGR